jgi:hypothetical protein
MARIDGAQRQCRRSVRVELNVWCHGDTKLQSRPWGRCEFDVIRHHGAALAPLTGARAAFPDRETVGRAGRRRVSDADIRPADSEAPASTTDATTRGSADTSMAPSLANIAGASALWHGIDELA